MAPRVTLEAKVAQSVLNAAYYAGRAEEALAKGDAETAGNWSHYAEVWRADATARVTKASPKARAALGESAIAEVRAFAATVK
ncbi:MAG: hypothetical protein ACYC3F_01055 [Gemmatimonadaceae bacterium]